MSLGLRLSLALLFLSFGNFVYAADDAFTVVQYVNTDFTPPSVPSILSAVPVSSDQIDIAWSTSTDNVLVTGYQLFRDAVPIATTTLLSYSDTGLTPSTTYTYTVRAFDWPKNYSALSASFATTTLGLPPTPQASTTPEYNSRINSRGGVHLLKLDIATDIDSANLWWQTDTYANYTLRWGRTVNYELGYVTTNVFSKDHTTRITDLEPGTMYEYELIGYLTNGDAFVLSKDTFKTKVPPDTTPPPNVSNLAAYLENGGVRLEWNNPTVEDFSHVRLLRSHLFYPNDPYDGLVVYQGKGSVVFDESAFNISPNQYYTIFTYDKEGNVSSGAIIFVNQKTGAISILDLDIAPSELSSSTEENIDIKFSDIEIIQDGKVIKPTYYSQVMIDGGKPVTVRIAYEKLPEHLKTITVTLTHPKNPGSVFSFLLKVNQEKTAYEATIAPFGESGIFDMAVTVFDFHTKKMKELEGSIEARYSVLHSSLDKDGNFVMNTKQVLIVTISLLLLILLVTWIIYGQLRDKSEERW